MDNITANHFGQLYKLLTSAMGEGRDRPVNQANLGNASRFPIRQMSMTIAMVHKLHKMTDDLDAACAFVLNEITEDEVNTGFDLKAISMELQGAFMVGYKTADILNIVEPCDRIKMARKRVGLTIREMAEKIEVSPTTIQNIESGKVDPRMSTMQKIAEACGVPADKLWPPYVF